jgi:hypothetical protein
MKRAANEEKKVSSESTSKDKLDHQSHPGLSVSTPIDPVDLNSSQFQNDQSELQDQDSMVGLRGGNKGAMDS